MKILILFVLFFTGCATTQPMPNPPYTDDIDLLWEARGLQAAEKIKSAENTNFDAKYLNVHNVTFINPSRKFEV